MSEREWEQLFDLMEKAINLKGLTAVEKGEKIKEEAISNGMEGVLEEFIVQCSE